jgi:hypothetical protein
MNMEQDMAGESLQMDMEPDLELAQALKDFKSSMDAWSEAAYNRPRLSQPSMAAKLAARPGWRMAASWVLGCAVVMGSLATAVHVVVHRQEMARIAAQKAAEQRAAAAQGTTQPASEQPVSAQTDKKTPAATVRKVSAAQDSAQARDSARGQDEDLLASVDSDVSRAVPAAMEPLAQLMDDNGTQ